MFYRFNRRYNLLKIDDTFARLVKIYANGDLEFEFSYSLSQLEAMQRDALKVSISVISRVVHRQGVLADSSRGFTDTRSLIKNVLMQMPNAKSTIQKQNTYVAAQKNSDVTSKINNEVISQLSRGTPPAQLQQLNKRVYRKAAAKSIKSNNDVQPILQQTALVGTQNIEGPVSGSSTRDSQSLMSNMIRRQGIDPSDITTLTPRTLSFDNAIQGVVRPSMKLETMTDPSSQLLNKHVFDSTRNSRAVTTDDVSDDQLVNVYVSEPEVNVIVKTKVVVPYAKRIIDKKRDVTNVMVKFVLIDINSGASVDTVTKQIDIAKHIQLYNTPRSAPRVKVSRSEISTRANLEIKQVDPNALGVQVFKKNVYTCVSDVDSYSLIGTYRLTSNNQSLLVQVDQPRNNVALYRVISTGANGIQGFEYTNVVVKPTHYSPLKFISLNVTVTEQGNLIEARKIPPDVVAIQFLVRNLTLNEIDWSVVGVPQLVSSNTRLADYVSIVDNVVNDGWTYEYAARLIYRSGDFYETGNAVIDYTQRTPGKFDVRIGPMTVNRDNRTINTQFSIGTKIIDTHLNVVNDLLKQQDYKQFFEQEIKDERDQLKDVVAHNIQRVNLTTGQRENFGTITAEQFSDADLRKNAGVSPLLPNNQYRYEITPLVRAPQTLFEKLTVNAIDKVTKKPYTFKPSKALHPMTLKKGIVVSPEGIKVKYAKDEMQLGAAGQVQMIDVSFDSPTPSIVDAQAAKVSDDLVTITWRVSGEISMIDHFLIMQEILGERHVVGKVHSEFTNGSCRYLHAITSHDIGNVLYVITPILNDYTTGTIARTNSIVV